HGRNNGKKLMAVRIVKHAFEIIHLLTDKNPIQVKPGTDPRTAVLAKTPLVSDPLVSCGDRAWIVVAEVGMAMSYEAVDVSPLRRVNQAIYLICTGARNSAFRNIKSISECLADEIMNAAAGP
ncbi:RPS5, partial [Symbiodinium necroappetens]